VVTAFPEPGTLFIRNTLLDNVSLIRQPLVETPTKAEDFVKSVLRQCIEVSEKLGYGGDEGLGDEDTWATIFSKSIAKHVRQISFWQSVI
jgi:hypothetical protein